MYHQYGYSYNGSMPIQGTSTHWMDYNQQCLQSALQLVKQAVQGEGKMSSFTNL
jgi:hypothetical protein